MKSIKLLFCVFGFQFSTNAQLNLEKNLTTEVGFGLVGAGNPNIFNLGINGRYFLSNSNAMLLNFGRNGQTTIEEFYESAITKGAVGKSTIKSSFSSISLGFQKHMNANFDKFSPFWGANFGLSFITEKTNNVNCNGINYNSDYTEKNTQKGTGVLVAFNLGFDYYITKQIFLGINYSPITIESAKINESITEINDAGNSTKKYEPSEIRNSFSTFSAFPILRLGWKLK